MTTRTSRLLRPPKDARCDFSTGAGIDSLGAPVVHKCPNPATVTGLAKAGIVREVWMCESCWQKRHDHFVRRVPKERA